MDAVQFFKIKSPEKFQINNLFTREVHKNLGALTETAFLIPSTQSVNLRKILTVYNVQNILYKKIASKIQENTDSLRLVSENATFPWLCVF